MDPSHIYRAGEDPEESLKQVIYEVHHKFAQPVQVVLNRATCWISTSDIAEFLGIDSVSVSRYVT